MFQIYFEMHLKPQLGYDLALFNLAQNVLFINVMSIMKYLKFESDDLELRERTLISMFVLNLLDK